MARNDPHLNAPQEITKAQALPTLRKQFRAHLKHEPGLQRSLRDGFE
jgi:hypothetical protein